MEILPVTASGKLQRFDDPEEFLQQMGILLDLGCMVSVQIAKTSIELFEQVHQLFQEHHLEVVITPDSDPTAADYVLHAFAGAAIGGVTGTILTAMGYCVARQIALRVVPLVLPGVGTALTIGFAAGAVIGAVASAVITRKIGMRVRFSPRGSQVLRLDLIPEKVEA